MIVNCFTKHKIVRCCLCFSVICSHNARVLTSKIHFHRKFSNIWGDRMCPILKHLDPNTFKKQDFCIFEFEWEMRDTWIPLRIGLSSATILHGTPWSLYPLILFSLSFKIRPVPAQNWNFSLITWFSQSIHLDTLQMSTAVFYGNKSVLERSNARMSTDLTTKVVLKYWNTSSPFSLHSS